MKYFIDEDCRPNNAYYEFQKGKFDNHTHWKDDSLLLSDVTFFDMHLVDLFGVLPDFNRYAVIEVDCQLWKAVKEQAILLGGEIRLLFAEADLWVMKNFENYDCFTIIGL